MEKEINKMKTYQVRCIFDDLSCDYFTVNAESDAVAMQIARGYIWATKGCSKIIFVHDGKREIASYRNDFND